MYVKRRFGVPSTTRPSSAQPSSTSSQPSSSVVFSSQPSPPTNSTSSSSSSSASLPPRNPAPSRGRLQVVGSTRPTHTGHTSPMLLSQSLSKSQGSIHHNFSTEPPPAPATTNGDSGGGISASDSNDEFRGLPSVRLLAQSFGSMSALNTASSSGFTRNSRPTGGGGGGAAHGRSSSSLLFSPGSRGVSRSSSSVGFLRGPSASSASSSSPLSFSSPSASVSTQRLFLTNKAGNNHTNSNNLVGKNGGDTDHQPNGGTTPQEQVPSSNHVNGTYGVQQQQQQQQQQRIRKNNSGRPPVSSSSFSIPTSSSSNNSETDNPLALARARLKNRGSRDVSLEKQDSTDASPVTSPPTSSPSTLPSQTPTPVTSATSEISAPQPAASTTTSTVKLSLIRNGVDSNAADKPNENSPSSTETVVSDKVSTTKAPAVLSSSSLRASSTTTSNNGNDMDNTSAAIKSNNNLWRSKSRDELEQLPTRQFRQYKQQSKQPGPVRESLLQQIQARRRYDDDDDVHGDIGSKGDNFKSTSKLSMSMPSLLQSGQCFSS